MQIVNVDIHSFKSASQLLIKNDLPVDDIKEETRLFALEEDGVMKGLVGIETYGHYALLRSLCVDASWRKNGIAKKLTLYIEALAKKENLKGIYLLTTTADKWFESQGYRSISRQEASEEIAGSTQFQTTCPSSAILMYKEV